MLLYNNFDNELGFLKINKWKFANSHIGFD